MERFKSRLLPLVFCLSTLGAGAANAVNVEYLWDNTQNIPKLNQVHVVNNTALLKEPVSPEARLFTLKNPAKAGLYEYRLRNAFIDAAGVTHARYDEFYKNLRVLWADTIVHNKKSQSINGTFVTEIEKDVPDIKPALTKEQAITIAKRDFTQRVASQGKETSRLLSSELVIYPYAKTARLAYEITYYTTGQNNRLANPYYIIDAHTGVVLDYFDNLKRALAQVGTGPGGNTNPNVTNKSYYYGSGGTPLLGALLIQTDTPAVGQCTWGNSGVAAVSLGDVANNPNIFPIIQTDEINYPTVIVNPCSAGSGYFNSDPANDGRSPNNDVLFYATQTYNLFVQTSGNNTPFGSNSLTSPAIRYYVHINSTDAFAMPAYCGAPDACNNQQTAFGNGQTQYYPQVTYDTVGHETAHIYIARTSNLVYANQSGGINEAFADITGAALGAYIGLTYTWFPPISSLVTPSFWAHGALDSRTSPALRYLFNPPLDGHSIANAANYTPGMDVHYSSGVYNKAFYLMSLAFGNNYSAVLKAYQYMVTANTTCWTSNMDFYQASCCVMLAAQANQRDLSTIRAAFTNVGVRCMRTLDKLSVTG